jgi:hypothetical protein
VRSAFAPFLIALLGPACRQLAGVEEIQPPPAPDAARVDAAKLDAGARCDCPGCTVLATGLPFPVSVVRVDRDLYVTSYGPKPGQGSLVRVPTTGGPVVTVLADLTHPSALASDGADLFWLAEDGTGRGVLQKRAVSGGPVQDLASGLQRVPLLYKGNYVTFPTSSLIAVSAMDVYFIDFLRNMGPVSVSSVSKNGGTPARFIASNLPDAGSLNPVAPLAIVAGHDALFWVDSNLNVGAILEAPFPTSSQRVLASNLVSPINLALGGDRIVFCDVGLKGTGGTVQSIPQSGGTPTTLLKGLSFPWAIVVDQGFAYCATLGEYSNGQIVKVGLDGGAEVTIVERTPQPVALALDDASIYWVDPLCGTVMRAGR